MNFSKSRLNKHENKMNKNKTLSYEEAVMFWQDLPLLKRIKLSKLSDIEIINKIYEENFNYSKAV